MATKLTPKQKEQKQIAATEARLAQEALFEKEHLEKLATYKVSLPGRLAGAKNLADSLGVRTDISLLTSGPEVFFRCDDSTNDVYIETRISYETEEWLMEELEDQLRLLKEKIDACEKRKQLAIEVFGRLTQDEKTVVKEFIHYLR